MSGGTAYDEDVAIGLPRWVTPPNDIKMNATIVRADWHQDGLSTLMNPPKKSGNPLADEPRQGETLAARVGIRFSVWFS